MTTRIVEGIEIHYLDRYDAERGEFEWRKNWLKCLSCGETFKADSLLFFDEPFGWEDDDKCGMCGAPGSMHLIGAEVYLYPVESLWAGVLREMMNDPEHPGYSLEGYSGSHAGGDPPGFYENRRVWGTMRALKF